MSGRSSNRDKERIKRRKEKEEEVGHEWINELSARINHEIAIRKGEGDYNFHDLVNQGKRYGLRFHQIEHYEKK
jgi:hypothetical protein